jgi:hypothetical protein
VKLIDLLDGRRHRDHRINTTEKVLLVLIVALLIAACVVLPDF